MKQNLSTLLNMEATLSQADNVPLIGELALTLQSQPRAPYVASRSQVSSYCPQNIVTHTGTNVMQFTIADSLAWCDPKSVAISMIITNTGAQPLEFLSTNMESLFSRMQVTMGGVIVEDHTQNYGRLCCLFTKYQSVEKILEQSSMQLGTRQDMTATGADAVKPVTPQLFSVEQILPNKIPAGEKRRVVMRLTMSSIFSGTDKWLPIFSLNGGIRVQMTLDAAANVVKVNDAAGQPTQSNQFQIEAAVLLWDAVTLDSALQEKYFAQLASGGSLLLETTQFSTSEVYLPLNQAGSVIASINKPVSRLNSVFCTFVPPLTADNKLAGKQIVNTFQGYGDFAYSRNDLVMQLSLGSTLYPMRPVHGYSEAYFRLLRTLGIVASQAHAIGPSRNDFNTNSFCLATDCEKVSTVASTGVNVQGIETRAECSFLANGANNVNSGVSRIFFHMHYQVFVEIRAGSCTLLT